MNLSIVRNDETKADCFLQSRLWAQFKALYGWSFKRYLVKYEDNNTSGEFGLSLLERNLVAGFRFAYIPHGPSVVIENKQELLTKLAYALKSEVSKKCLFIRFDTAWYYSGEASDTKEQVKRPVLDKPFRKGSDVQPPDSTILDISKPIDEILSGMKNKWRYNIRLAEKKGVTVSSEGLSAIDDYYSMYETTSKRDKIAIHPLKYYKSLLSLSESNNDCKVQLWIARHEGQALAGIITVFYGKEATYLYGASSDEKRNLMPAYALQWTAIQAAKEYGCTEYDFYGLPPYEDPNHPMSGLFRFKTGFGGQMRHYTGSWDFVLNHFVYFAYNCAEKLRLFYYKTLKKKL